VMTTDEMVALSVKLAEAALMARERGDDVYTIFFAVKAAEVLSLAKLMNITVEEAP
jgi:hypothetical protein